jgi:hypothetical protein
LGTLITIGKTFASDHYDRADPDDFLSSKFMIWREEQRAMGELARDHDRDAVAGFATFATAESGPDARWIGNFIDDLKDGNARTSTRLDLIQSLLGRLVRELDPDKAYLVDNARGEKTEPNWMRRTAPDPAARLSP